MKLQTKLTWDKQSSRLVLHFLPKSHIISLKQKILEQVIRLTNNYKTYQKKTVHIEIKKHTCKHWWKPIITTLCASSSFLTSNVPNNFSLENCIYLKPRFLFKCHRFVAWFCPFKLFSSQIPFTPSHCMALVALDLALAIISWHPTSPLTPAKRRPANQAIQESLRLHDLPSLADDQHQ